MVPVASAPRVVTTARIEPTVEAIAWKRVAGVQAGARPLLVWISDANGDSTLEHRVFDDDAVRLAARAFRTVRVQPELALKDPYLAVYARSAPTMVVFSPDLKRASPVPAASLTARSAFDALRASARADEGLDLDAAVQKVRALLTEEKTVQTSRATLVHGTAEETALRADLDRRLAVLRTAEDEALRPTASR